MKDLALKPPSLAANSGVKLPVKFRIFFKFSKKVSDILYVWVRYLYLAIT